MSFFDDTVGCKCVKVSEAFQKLRIYQSKSLLKKYLTPDLFDGLKNRATPVYGGNIKDVIQSGLENLDSQIGVYAPDPDAYSTFRDLFNPIIESYHGHKLSENQPKPDFGTPKQLKQFVNLDPMGQFIKKIVISTSRNLSGFPFTPLLTYEMFQDIEIMLTNTFKHFPDEIKGRYFTYRTLDPEMEKYLDQQRFLFHDTSKHLRSALAFQGWPIGRGAFINYSNNFLIWVNGEDHVQIISMDNCGHIGCVYRRFMTALTILEKEIPFQRTDQLGYVTLCPSNLGTALNTTVFIKLPKLSKTKQKLKILLKAHSLQIGGKDAILGKFEDKSVVAISNIRKLGLTEYQVMDSFQTGILDIIKAEINYKCY